MQVIAIDGPAASGKSSVAKLLAQELGWVHVNTGNHYRAVTWAVVTAGIDPQNAAAIADFVSTLDLKFVPQDKHIIVQVNGHTLTDAELTSEAVTKAVSVIARVQSVRHRLAAEQRALAQNTPVVMEGRDIGTVVFPDTPNNFYIDASPAVRRQRREAQGIIDNVEERDKNDRAELEAHTEKPGVIVIDSSHITIPQVVERVRAALRL